MWKEGSNLSVLPVKLSAIFRLSALPISDSGYQVKNTPPLSWQLNLSHRLTPSRLMTEKMRQRSHMIVLPSIYVSFSETWTCHSSPKRTEYELIIFNFRGYLSFSLFGWKPPMQYRRPQREELLQVIIRFRVQFGINLHEWVFQKAEIARAASASSISAFWKNSQVQFNFVYNEHII